MYLIYNEQTYEHVRMQNTSSSVRFVGDSLPALEELTDLIMVFPKVVLSCVRLTRPIISGRKSLVGHGFSQTLPLQSRNQLLQHLLSMIF